MPDRTPFELPIMDAAVLVPRGPSSQFHSTENCPLWPSGIPTADHARLPLWVVAQMALRPCDCVDLDVTDAWNSGIMVAVVDTTCMKRQAWWRQRMGEIARYRRE